MVSHLLRPYLLSACAITWEVWKVTYFIPSVHTWLGSRPFEANTLLIPSKGFIFSDQYYHLGYKLYTQNLFKGSWPQISIRGEAFSPNDVGQEVSPVLQPTLSNNILRTSSSCLVSILARSQEEFEAYLSTAETSLSQPFSHPQETHSHLLLCLALGPT